MAARVWRSGGNSSHDVLHKPLGEFFECLLCPRKMSEGYLHVIPLCRCTYSSILT